MENVTFIEFKTLEGIQEHAIIDRNNGEFTSMLKSVYDEQQALADAQTKSVYDEQQALADAQTK